MERVKTPAEAGFHMPGEYEPHRGCIMIWPERPGSWPHEAKAAREAFAAVIRAISESEEVLVAVSSSSRASAEEALRDIPGVVLFDAETDDAWARDVAPTFVIDAERHVKGINWTFNAWGGEYNGLYADWQKDDAFAHHFARTFGYEMFEAAPFVLEGGSIHSDGEGTVMVTEACLLSPGRNPSMSKADIENRLKAFLGAEKVIWLPRGIYNDETDEHVDNVCAFTAPGEVVLAWSDDPENPQYSLSRESMKVLEEERDARGRKIKVHKLPVPDEPVLVTEEDLEGYVFAEGEDNREAGERLAASYVNFYFSNGAVVMPAFGGIHEADDLRAQEILRSVCPGRKIIPVYARDILLGGGNIHCITQQIPKGML